MEMEHGDVSSSAVNVEVCFCIWMMLENGEIL